MVVCPGDIKVEIKAIRHFIQHMDGGTNSSIHMGVHTGTHMDAPRHFFAKGKSIDQMPFDTAIGPARHNLWLHRMFYRLSSEHLAAVRQPNVLLRQHRYAAGKTEYHIGVSKHQWYQFPLRDHICIRRTLG